MGISNEQVVIGISYISATVLVLLVHATQLSSVQEANPVFLLRRRLSLFTLVHVQDSDRGHLCKEASKLTVIEGTF